MQIYLVISYISVGVRRINYTMFIFKGVICHVSTEIFRFSGFQILRF